MQKKDQDAFGEIHGELPLHGGSVFASVQNHASEAA